MKKSGLADSPFFQSPQAKVEASTPASANPPVQKVEPEKIKRPRQIKTVQPSNRDTTVPSNHATTVSRYHDTMPPRVHGVVIELVRKAVKEFGKEAATHRFTETEKKESNLKNADVDVLLADWYNASRGGSHRGGG